MIPAPILTIVPLIIRRLRGPSPHRLLKPSPAVPASLLHRDRHRLKRRPQKPREFPRDRDGDLRGRFMFGRHCSEPPTQPLLRLVRNRNDAPWLSGAPPPQCDADTRTMLIVPRRFDQQPSDQRVPVRVMRPRRCFSPLESSPGTSPRYAINAGADANRRTSCSSARINIAVNVSMPRKHRNQPTGSRYGAVSAIVARCASIRSAATRCDRSPTDSRRPRHARPRAAR